MDEPLSDFNPRRAATQLLESLHRAGVEQLPRVAAPSGPAVASPVPARPAATQADERQNIRQPEEEPMPRPVRTETRLPVPPAAKPAPAPSLLASGVSLPVLPLAERAAACEALQGEVAACTLCPELVANRSRTVFGVGHLQPELAFFGEAPGADEDRQGEPFVGAAGRLLNDIIIKGMKMRREDVYILNVLKCRPPNNRPPAPEEVANCRPFFERQLAILRPKFICCLGLHAAQSLLDTKSSVGKLRGRLHEYRGSQVLVTYHPAYLLRNPAAKKDTWEDVKLLLAAMGRPAG